MRLISSGRTIGLSLVAAVVALSLFTTAAGTSAGPTVVANKYIGAAKCKNCHRAEDAGNQYGKWESMKHAHAFEVLGTDAAKKAGAERGVENPQEADACLKCHVTAFGEPEDAIKRGFKVEKGVQCETCHGPGEQHMKLRMTAAAKGETNAALEADEVILSPGRAVCVECHNDESPSYKPFCYCKSIHTIRHINPEKPRTAEELAALAECPCEDDCECKEDCCEEQMCSLLTGEADDGK